MKMTLNCPRLRSPDGGCGPPRCSRRTAVRSPALGVLRVLGLGTLIGKSHSRPIDLDPGRGPGVWDPEGGELASSHCGPAVLLIRRLCVMLE